MRIAAWGLTLSLGACGGQHPTPEVPPAVDGETDPIGTETDAETDHGHVSRPLCDEVVDPAPMAADLEAWAASTRASGNRFFGEVPWRALEDDGEPVGAEPEREVRNRILRGWYRLRFGDFEGAVADLERAEALAVAEVPAWRQRAREMLAVVWMRQAETQNCIINGSGHACVIPFNEHGTHDDPTGMARAEAVLARVLREDQPTAFTPRWLYNVTFMARGLWPDGVEPAWRLGEDFLVSEVPFPAWTNVAPDVGIHATSLAGGSALNDVDGDGLLDLVVSSMEPEVGMELFLNTGDGRFCEATAAAGLSGITGVLDFKMADYDNDGDLDIFAPRAGWLSLQGSVRPSLLRNDGRGRFEDVAVVAGVSDARFDGPTQVAAWGDVDNDGWLDLFVGREDDDVLPGGRRVSSLYINQRDGTFVDVAFAAGVAASGFVKGASFLDADEDGFLDLYVSAMRGEDHFYHNNGDLTFTDRAQAAGVLKPRESFSSAALDYNQDGHLDLLVAAFPNRYDGGGPLDATYFQSMEAYLVDAAGGSLDALGAETAHLYAGDGAGGFRDVTVEVGLDDGHATMGMSVDDLNMDGFPDLYFATGAPEYDALEPNTAYVNDGGLRFHDVTVDMRTGQIQKGHGVSFGDVDEDGDLDLYVKMGGAFRSDPSPSALFLNPTNALDTRTRHAVTLQLEGVTVNRSAIGARVRIVTPERTFHHLVGETGSFGGNSLQVEAALGASTSITRIEVQWPGAELETVTGVPLDAVISLRQGEGVVASRAYRTFGLDSTHD